MTTHPFITRLICLFAAASLLSSCVVVDRLKQSLQQPTASAKKLENRESGPQSELLADVLYFAGQIYHMPEEERIKNATALRNVLQTSPFPKDRMVLALLALYVKEDTLPTSEALKAIEELDPAEVGNDPQLLGLINVLRQSLMRIELEKQTEEKQKQELMQAAEKYDKLNAELAAEKKKTTEMAQKLQKLLEIEKIMEQRKE